MFIYRFRKPDLFLKLMYLISENRFLSQIISILSLTTGPTNRVSLNTNFSFFQVSLISFSLICCFKEINQMYISNSKINCYIHSEFHGFVSFCDFRVNLPIFQVFFLLIRSTFTRAFLPLASSVSWYISNTSLISCNFLKLGKILRSQYSFQVYFFVSPPFQANKR